MSQLLCYTGFSMTMNFDNIFQYKKQFLERNANLNPFAAQVDDMLSEVIPCVLPFRHLFTLPFKFHVELFNSLTLSVVSAVDELALLIFCFVFNKGALKGLISTESPCLLTLKSWPALLWVPEYGWTTQEGLSPDELYCQWSDAVVFGFHKQVFLLHTKAFALVLLDLPGLLFFSTYTLLVLFWAEIYHQARSLPTDKLRVFYVSINGIIYFIQVCIWVYLGINDNSVIEFIGKIFIAVISFIAALGFLLYGGRLFFMLRRFPIESKGRRKKLHRVMLSAFDSDVSLDVLDHPVLNLIYYTLVEILPSALVLYISRKLPPKRVSAQYHPLR
ncbi:tobamovirus multiplication 1 [Striga asiatica]|uniref:Tobamovirus multiplication 1 n=1 Tax=Striga asiatica TaxID=4170 RepID=A0A5A7RBW4_STRAF|nr:tobamovirus multiplication 1 [Striga asiatica]